MSTELMRAEFEAWMSDGGEFPKAVQRSADGQGYLLMIAQSAWVAWQAAWNRRAPLPAEQPSNPVPRMGGNTKELTDDQVIEIAQDMAISRYSDRDDILMFAEALRRARIVGQQTKGGGNG